MKIEKNLYKILKKIIFVIIFIFISCYTTQSLAGTEWKSYTEQQLKDLGIGER